MSSKKQSWTKTQKAVTYVLSALLLVAAGYAVYVRRENAIEEAKPIVFIHPQLGNPWYGLHAVGFFKACDELGVECKEYADSSGTVDGWLNLCDRMMGDGGPRALMATVHNDSFVTCLNQAQVPWANVHGKWIDDPNFVTSITPDIDGYSAAAAHAMAGAVGRDGEVIVTVNSYNDLENRVIAVFCETLEANYGLTCANEPVECGMDVVAGIGIASSLLSQYPDAVGALNSSSFGPAIWAGAAKEAGYEKGELIIIGMDPVQENLDLIAEGWVHAIVAQPGYEENYQAVYDLVAFMNGEEVPSQRLLPAPIVTADGVDQFTAINEEVQAYLDSQ